MESCRKGFPKQPKGSRKDSLVKGKQWGKHITNLEGPYFGTIPIGTKGLAHVLKRRIAEENEERLD